MLLRGRNTVGYTPYPTAVTDAFVAGGRRDRHRHLPHLRRPQRRRADAAGDRGRAGDRHRRRRGRALLHRRPDQPGREALHPRLLPRARRADRRRRRARARDQGHGRAAARPRRPHPGHARCASGSTCRCTCTPTTPRAASSRPCSPRSTPASTRSTPPPPRWPVRRPSRALSALVAATDHSDRETGLDLEAVCALEPYWEATRRVYAPFESGPGLADRPRLHPRDPRRPALQPAPAGDRARPRREVRADRGHVRRRQRHPRQRREGDARPPRSSATSRCTSSRSAPTRRSSRRTPGKFDIPDSVIGFLNGELGDPPGGWPEPFRDKALEGRTWKQPVGELTDEQAEGLAPEPPRRPSTSCSSPARPRRSTRSARRTATSRCCRRRDYLYGLRQGEEHVVDDRGGQAPDPRACRRSARPTSAATAP